MIRRDNSTTTLCTLFIVDSVPDVDVGGVGDIPAGRVQVDHVGGAAPRVQVTCQPGINIFNISYISVRFYKNEKAFGNASDWIIIQMLMVCSSFQHTYAVS